MEDVRGPPLRVRRLLDSSKEGFVHIVDVAGGVQAGVKDRFDLLMSARVPKEHFWKS